MSNTPKATIVLKKIRDSRNLSFQELAKIMDMSRQYCFRVESGFYQLPLDYYNKLVKKLHITTTEAEELKKALVEDFKSNLNF